MAGPLDAEAVAAALVARPAWSSDGAALRRTVTCASFRAAVALLDAVAEVAEEMDHHPDMTLRYRDLGLRLRSHDAGGITERDLRLASRIDALVDSQAGAPPEA